jgi:hypothetical protein
MVNAPERFSVVQPARSVTMIRTRADDVFTPSGTVVQSYDPSLVSPWEMGLQLVPPSVE